MDIPQIHNCVKNIIREKNGLKLLLSFLREEIHQQKGYKYCLVGATEVLEFDCVRYLFVCLPEEDERTQSVENKLTQIVQEAIAKHSHSPSAESESGADEQ